MTSKSTAKDRKRVMITVYNSNRALVTEEREVTLPEGKVNLWFQDVPSKIMPQTVSIHRIKGSSFEVLEQNYEYDLISPKKLLQKYLNREIVLVQQVEEKDTTKEKRLLGKLLSLHDGLVFLIGDKIVTNPPYAYLEFPELPENLYAQPTLVWFLDTQGGESTLEARYLTQGMNWVADYVFNLSADDKKGSLQGWVTLTNQSGATFKDATLKLIAGDVRTVEKEPPRYRMMAEAKVAAAPFEEKAFFEYHLYTLTRPTTLKDNQQKQVELLTAQNIGIKKHYMLRGKRWYFYQRVGDKQTEKVDVVVSFANTKQNGMGMALPKGIVRVYKKDTDGSSQFIGEDQIDHTPKDETIHLTLGQAFDIVAERKQMDYRVLSSCMNESSFEIELRNHKEEDVTITILEPVGGEWEILSHSHPYKKKDAFTIQFEVPVPANGKTTLTYRVRNKYC